MKLMLLTLLTTTASAHEGVDHGIHHAANLQFIEAIVMLVIMVALRQAAKAD